MKKPEIASTVVDLGGLICDCVRRCGRPGGRVPLTSRPRPSNQVFTVCDCHQPKKAAIAGLAASFPSHENAHKAVGVLNQERSQRLPWCLALAPALGCSAKDEVNVFLGALRQRPPSAVQPRNKSTSSLVPRVSARPQLLSQGRSQRLPWCLASALASSCSAKEEDYVFIGALRQCPPSAARQVRRLRT
ncbi:hypothetical protein LSAT2_009437 [Lamellibrachia satsuma]|nr:hypothetical protein LSAT2_009437 [Lamellibrachia satsuma]